MGNSKNISLIFLAVLPALFIFIVQPVTSISAHDTADKQEVKISKL
ncbi:MAG: hypothetical protein WBN66_02955 [Smithella sp.]